MTRRQEKRQSNLLIRLLLVVVFTGAYLALAVVIVNGVAVIERGDHTGALPGRLLRRCGAILT